MAVLRPAVVFNFEPLQQLARQFPEFNGRFLALIGSRARRILKEDYLSGQELTYKSFGRSKSGQHFITSDVNKKRTSVKIYSFPLNLFEKGRMLRSGRKESGKFIITRKLKQDIMSRTGRYADEFERRILQKELKGLGL